MHNETYSYVVATLFLKKTAPVCRPFLLLPYSFTQFPQEVNPDSPAAVQSSAGSSSTPVDFPFASWFSACLISSLSGGGPL